MTLTVMFRLTSDNKTARSTGPFWLGPFPQALQPHKDPSEPLQQALHGRRPENFPDG